MVAAVGVVGQLLLPPTANDDAYSTTEDQTLSVSASGVLGNDTDPQNYNLTAILNSNPSNGTLSLNSDGSFTYTPNTGYTGSDSFTYYANDGVQDSNVATVTIDVSPAAATQFVVSAPSSTTAGNNFDFTVTAEDPFGNTDTNYSGTVGFSSSDGQATLPANATLTNGVGTFSATLFTAGPQTLTATDTVDASITGSADITVNPAAATQLVVAAPSSTTAGNSFDFTVTAEDPFGNTDTNYSGTVGFSSSDGQATLPADSTLTNGVGTFSATLYTAGPQTLTATDTGNSSITGSANITVSPAAATQSSSAPRAAPQSATASAFSVTPLDPFNNIATGYSGTVSFSSSDGQANLPGYSTLTNGVGTFSATLDTAGNQTLTATDTSNSSLTATANYHRQPGGRDPARHQRPSSTTAGNSFTFSVTALDQFNNIATGYSGTVSFSSSDGQANLPGYSTLTNGVGTFSATLDTAGSQTLTATDTFNGSLTATATITVSPAAATQLVVSAPASTTVGNSFTFTVTARDQFNNIATGYSGTVSFSSSDGQANLPGSSTLTNGVGTFSATLDTAGSQTLTATDTGNSSLTGSATINVSPAAATQLVVSAPSSTTVGSSFDFTVTAEDQFNNIATNYSGIVSFSSSDSQANLPGNTTLTNGVGTFSATFDTAG